MMNAIPPFEVCFNALTGHKPMRWQARLFKCMAAGTVPPACELPTGLGKTSVIPIWLIALVRQDPGSCVQRLPRRLVYIVNRRTVVDQATDVVKELRERLRNPLNDRWSEHKATLNAFRGGLGTLSAGGDEDELLGVSTLRGELADNEEWKADPARPAIVVGTIDMIGSKLLFSGYGDGRRDRVHHAGLIGQDVLIVHDEAHLSPAFSRLLWKVEREQRKTGEGRPVNVMELSATSRLEASEDRDAVTRLRPGRDSREFLMEDADREEAIVKDRLEASKVLEFVPVEGSGKGAVVAAIAESAFSHDDEKCRVLIYVRSPEIAQGVGETLAAKVVEKAKRSGGTVSKADANGRIRLLTGTIRGFERDQFAESDLFKAFRSNPNRPARLQGRTLYLVSTSAGEVGVDLDADHLVCDLSTLDAMAQRLGRVNRLGGKDRAAKIGIIVERASEKEGGAAKKKEKQRSRFDEALAATERILKEVEKRGGDASPATLAKVLKHADAEAAFSPKPAILRATDVLFDAWSLTSIGGNLPGRPPVEPYLHGIADWEPPETYVAWRTEVSHLAGAEASEEDLEHVFDVFPLRSIELLRDRSDRVFEQLQMLAKRYGETRVIVMKAGAVGWASLPEIAPPDQSQKAAAVRRLAFATIVLPVEVGSLRNGCLDGDAQPPDDPRTLDVAEWPTEGGVDRQRVWVRGERDRAPVVGEAELTGLVVRHTVHLGDGGEGGEDGDAPRSIEYRTAKGRHIEPDQRIGLARHSSDAAAAAERIGRALALPCDLRSALTLAGRRHDVGKEREIWQRYARNRDLRNPVAKAERYLHWKALGGYRHEFGSLLEAKVCEELRNHPERDLVLHLIAAHHGWARPHCEPRAFDHQKFSTARNEEVAAEMMRRFGRLQRRFGRWGLAWLESLLRCADIAASKAGAGGGAPAPRHQEVGT
jgi:CRISPR-associated endonuclease/helicase Cas3